MQDSTDQKILHTITPEDLVKILIMHFNVHEGKFALAMNFRIGIGQVPGPPDTMPLPGATLGIEGLGIQRVPDDASGVGIFDAAELNPGLAKKLAAKPAKKKLPQRG